MEIRELYEKRNFTVEDVDNLHPKIRLIIDNYLWFDYTQNTEYEVIADSLLEKLINKLSVDIFSDLINDLYLIGCGIIYLIKNGWLLGEVDDILSDIDAYLFVLIEHKEGKTDFRWPIVLRYVRLRIMDRSEEQNMVVLLMLRLLCIKLLDIINDSDIVLDEELRSEVRLLHEMKLCPSLTTRLLNLSDINIIYPKLIDRKSVSFVIPLRVDSQERAFNLDIVLEQLSMIECAEISILEADVVPRYKLKKKFSKVKYSFVYDESIVFYRTRYINQLLRQSKGSIVGVWDTDVIIDQNQIIDSVNSILEGKAVISFPYSGDFFMLTEPDTRIFVDDYLSSGIVNKDWANTKSPCVRHSVGGAFFVNKECYQDIGGENEHFIGWGPEDIERVKRCEILGYPVFRTKGPLFHLYHPRNINSYYGSDELELKNRQEFLRICAFSNTDLKSYIKTWKWH